MLRAGVMQDGSVRRPVTGPMRPLHDRRRWLDSTAVHDILIKDCEGYNGFDSHSFYQEFTGTDPFAFTGGLEYANGHVFTTEEFACNIEFEGCGGSGSHDSIFDLKSDWA